MHVGFEALIDRVGQNIRLRSTQLDGSPHFAWTCRLIDASSDRLVLHQAAGTSIATWREVWTPDFEACLYFWRDKWFNVIQTLNVDDGSRRYHDGWRGFYCNVITPAQWEDDELRWHDLDLDVSVQRDGEYRLRDEDEWARNVARFNDAPEVVVHARRAADELIDTIARRALPFDAIERIVR